MTLQSTSQCCSGKKTKATKLQWDPVLEPFVNHLVTSNGVKIRPAIEVGKKAVEYCRASDLMKWMLRNEETLRNKFPSCFEDPSIPLTPKDAESFVEELCRSGFIYRTHYKPISNRPSAATEQQQQSAQEVDSGKQTGNDNSIPKWPKRLEMSQDQRYDMNAFYVFRYEPKSHWPYIYLALIIGAVLTVCLFPAWPLALKLFTWYISVCLLTFIVSHNEKPKKTSGDELSSVVIRLVLFLLFWFFGVDFWLFPNLFDEELGVIDSFKPLYTWERRKDDLGMIAARIFLAILLLGTVYQLSRTHSLSDVHRFAAQLSILFRQFLDILDWGHQKLAAPPPESSVPVAKFQMHQAESDADPSKGFRCMQPCGFDSYDALKEECLFDCSCLKEVIDSHCFKNCPEAAKKSLEQSKDEACSSDVTNDGAQDVEL